VMALIVDASLVMEDEIGSVRITILALRTIP
jgi:hypothetical protein